MVDSQSPTAEIRRGKKEEDRRRRRKKLQGKNIMGCPITKGDHNKGNTQTLGKLYIHTVGLNSTWLSVGTPQHQQPSDGTAATTRKAQSPIKERWVAGIASKNDAAEQVLSAGYIGHMSHDLKAIRSGT